VADDAAADRDPHRRQQSGAAEHAPAINPQRPASHRLQPAENPLLEPPLVAAHVRLTKPQVGKPGEERHRHLARSVGDRPAAAAHEPQPHLPRPQFLVAVAHVAA